MKKLINSLIILSLLSCKKETSVTPPHAEGTVSIEYNENRMVFDLFYVNNYLDVERVQNVNIICANTAQRTSEDPDADFIDYISLDFKQNNEIGKFELYDFQLGRQKGLKRMFYSSTLGGSEIAIKYIPEIQEQFRMKGTFSGALDWFSSEDGSTPATNNKVINLENGIFDLTILRKV
ncbi:MAG: hypothetical protein ACI9V1_002355 [Spirosomataceae bacterium]|jgi:hypothetical protein